MRLLPASVAVSDCPTCATPLKTHPLDGCTCQHDLCNEVATTRVTRSARRIPTPLCDRHTRAQVVGAERFGYALVLQAMPTDVPLAL